MDQQNHTGFSEVCDTIVNSLGLHFPEDRWEMLARNLTMAAPAFGFPQTEDFISWLLCADLKKKEIELLASYLTISETYFWREPQVFSALTDLILPEIVAAKKMPTVLSGYGVWAVRPAKRHIPWQSQYTGRSLI